MGKPRDHRIFDSLTEALSFDRALARRVRSEFEDHLEEAIACDQCRDRVEAARRAIAKCGDPRAIAEELAVTSLARRSRRLAVGIVVALVSVFLAMKGRVAWYATMQWSIPDSVQPAAITIGTVARYAFGAAMFLGMTSWLYGSWRRSPSAYSHPVYFKHLHRFCLLSGVATAALAICILTDVALATIRLEPISPSAAFFIPVASIAFELSCVIALVILIRSSVRRAVLASHLRQA
jgi:hypothetical protein